MRRTREERRRDTVEACRARFVGKEYEPGSRDCVKLAGHAMHQMGHRVGLTKGLRYSTEAGGLRALKRLGFADLLAAMDATGRPRIAPAAALPADILAFPSSDALGACLFVYAGNGKAHGFQEGYEVGVTLTLSQPAIAAWRL